MERIMSHLVISNREISNATYFESPEALEHYLDVWGDYNSIDTLVFAFWSWIVPSEMLKKYHCFGLHTSPLLEGRGKGGSPIENLQRLGVEWTTLCAFEMTNEIDGGRVRLAIPLCIKCKKEWIVDVIDDYIPNIVAYLTAKQPEIPERFKRV